MREVSLTDLPEWEALRAATVALYEAFAPYPLRACEDIPRCTHCVTDADDARLRAKPLRELTDDELRIVLYNPGTWGAEADFKHFLPRLFELVSLEIAGQPSGLDGGWLGSSVRTEGHGIDVWPALERTALMSFCLAWWRATLAVWPSVPFTLDGTAEAVLCAVAQFTDDLAPYLAAWRQALVAGASPASLAHLLVLLCQQVTPPPWLESPEDVWWEDRPEQWRQVRHWLDEPATTQAAHRALRRAREREPGLDARWFDAEDPQDVAPALTWLARRVQDT